MQITRVQVDGGIVFSNVMVDVFDDIVRRLRIICRSLHHPPKVVQEDVVV